MAFIPTLHAIKITIIGSIAGQEVVIDITIGTPSSVSPADLSDSTDAVLDWLDTDLKTNVTEDYTFGEMKAYDLTSSSAPVLSTPISVAGIVTEPPVPNNVALVTTFYTANRGRSGRGRNYLAGSQNNIGDSISTNAGHAASVVAAWANLNSYLSPLGMEHVVISQYTGGAARVAGLKQAVVSYATNVDYDSQRRRLAGRGA